MTKILIAEDDSDIRDLVTFTLRFAGYEVTAVTNGEEAVIHALQEIPDLILLDVRMPRMTGYEACARIKEYRKTQNIPVVFLSAKGQDGEVQAGLSVGAVEYLLKPFAPDQLITRVRSLLEQYKKPEAARGVSELTGQPAVQPQPQVRVEMPKQEPPVTPPAPVIQAPSEIAPRQVPASAQPPVVTPPETLSQPKVEAPTVGSDKPAAGMESQQTAAQPAPEKPEESGKPETLPPQRLPERRDPLRYWNLFRNRGTPRRPDSGGGGKPPGTPDAPDKG